ncbi:hypothetical protein VFPPC_17165 [Pochonia chlamydosporia 170]|uniref:Uncharacterized protein n=1 Tax=Pochonia chlamydosporia 170 TaxID=1380566 RepID=A0A179EWE9_METCM|nr:hypothetical protein VFPPC_17165 [Pochonia chlamydosporia 170]OAQ57482.1 hypothetical protein VFPPC_17165 [Pochonia chlamydosporia 170]
MWCSDLDRVEVVAPRAAVIGEHEAGGEDVDAVRRFLSEKTPQHIHKQIKLTEDPLVAPDLVERSHTELPQQEHGAQTFGHRDGQEDQSPVQTRPPKSPPKSIPRVSGLSSSQKNLDYLRAAAPYSYR